MNAAFACANYNAPGIGGPEDAPEYNGPSVEDLVAQKMRDPRFLRDCAEIPADVYQLAIIDDALGFRHRFLYEARKAAQREAEAEDAELRRDFYRSAA